ncbi:hypothetical protein JYP52_16570 [Nitratireductor aquibiodomus]|uniref:hypothetical protein n=1 Tax=Nitratireductor aquibiodomus TaxID=204799 RepID=UPI0019D3DBE2|nr:hypothetical protein [Nitratireductor aquibiodomus]MBN7762756.1 hypothetical protein [Nitratireductor aquibiodomus]
MKLVSLGQITLREALWEGYPAADGIKSVLNNIVQGLRTTENYGIALNTEEQDITFVTIVGNTIVNDASALGYGVRHITESTTTIDALLVGHNNIKSDVGIGFNSGASVGTGKISGIVGQATTNHSIVSMTVTVS